MHIRNLLKLRSKYDKKMTTSIIAIKFVNLDSMIDIYGPEKIMQDYTKCVKKIHNSTTKMEGHLGELTGNFMVLFFLEEENKNHAEKACRSELIIRQSINELNSLYNREGVQNLKVRIGIHTGEVIVSNKLKLLGEHVNIATKIMEECDPDKDEILVSETTMTMASDQINFLKKKHLSINLPSLFPNLDQLSLYGIKDYTG